MSTNTTPTAKSPAYTDKFVAFIDILGFTSKVEASENDPTLLPRLLEMVSKLGDGTERAVFEKYGPICCPEAPQLSRDMDYCATQISDCVIISSEVSPAGVINLVDHCWKASIRLLQLGVLCRGFVTRGFIYHTPNQFIGPGYLKALQSERTVSAFKRSADDKGTPFVEFDEVVFNYVSEQPDKCVKMMFERFTKFDGQRMAIFPFKRLNHDFGAGSDPAKDLQSVDTIRGWIALMKERIHQNITGADEKAVNKARHYLDALDVQLVELDQTEQMIKMMREPAVKVFYGANGGLVRKP